jgi:hypothetical protein
MGFDRKLLKELTKPLYGFDGKIIETVEVITLPVSFGTPKNSRTEYITFDIVDMLYPYNTIFGRCLLNTFEATLHSDYLYLKISTVFGVISVFGSQQDARNIEMCFTLGHKNVQFLQEEPEQHNTFIGPCIIEARQNTRKPSKPRARSREPPWTLEFPIEPCALARSRANNNKWSY